MKSIGKKKAFIVLGTCVGSVLLFMLFTKYYNVKVDEGVYGEGSTLLNIAMIFASLGLGWVAATALVELKETIKFLKISVDNKKLIKTLSRNDFKSKFAGSYFGIAWAFIHPVITILVYWFVFQGAFKQGDVAGKPFIFWFIAGIIPWFFFSEALPSTSNVFLEYGYLVKKVVFKIEVLPMVKIISALFVHVFFIGFIYLIMALYGYYPDAYTLQFIYYSFALVSIVYSVSVMSSAIILFFRDFGQIINVILSVGFWFTPIGWNVSILPKNLAILFKLNPLYYIVTGYRDAFIDKIYFWERPYGTLYFWVLCLVILSLGIKIYNRLKPHFSDVI
ncbi:Teichoic acid translocation permease protein TagG [Clostridium vincentii]|uniref:Transport permease protein n=2 Tax=Clostridium vincentii TaxID=52704 RepID=A0A2T0BGS9_9CLOT|nr:Teichoic acid translocation permease protein TagG [Clostridium vincentii]